MTYTCHTQGISYRIIGYLGEDDRYEVYHGKSTSPQRHIILHLLKTGNGRIYPKAEHVEKVIVQPSTSVGRSHEDQVVPWRTDKEGLEERKNEQFG